MSQPTVSIAIITYNSKPYLERLLTSIQNQTYPEISVLVLDNDSEDDTLSYLDAHFPKIPIIASEENIGFCKGHNLLFQHSDGDFHFIVNDDMVLDPTCVQELVDALLQDPKRAVAGPKVYQWDASTDTQYTTLDTGGIRITPWHQFVDHGQGKEDTLEFCKEREVFGISGCALMIRRSAAQDIAYGETATELFDEHFWIYKEDCDLAYRLQSFGYSAWFIPQAQAYHNRTAFGGTVRFRLTSRMTRKSYITKYSLHNQGLLLLKNMPQNLPLLTKAKAWISWGSTLLFTIVFHWNNARHALQLFKKEYRSNVVRKTSPAIKPQKILQWMKRS